MGREIRRVPPDWEHPKNDRGHFRPLLDCTFEEELADWTRRRDEWNAPGNERRADWEAKHGPTTFEEFEGDAPDRETYRPAWPDGSDTAFQVYENVTEGTPISPVLPTREALVEWLVNDGSGMGIGGTPMRLSRAAAERFANAGYAPSMIAIEGVGMFSGAQCYEREPAASPRSDRDEKEDDRA